MPFGGLASSIGGVGGGWHGIPGDTSVAGAFAPVAHKFRSLGLVEQEELQALLSHASIRNRVVRGEDIIRSGSSPRRLTVLLDGIACSYNSLDVGDRQICAFHYRGDFCDLHRYVLPEADGTPAVGALTDCLIGTIDFKDVDLAITQHPALGLIFWRAAMLEASVVRERLIVSRRTARERIAHLLCEQLERLEAIDMKTRIVPLTQIDLADAAGLSAVQTNRTIQEFRSLGLLSSGKRLEVTDRKGLAELAKFDNDYLNMAKILAGWTTVRAATV